VAEHRTHRWLQFGILDMLILTAVVAVAIPLTRPIPPGKVTQVLPSIVGQWRGHTVNVTLFPDGVYSYYQLTSPNSDFGTDWKLSRAGIDGSFILQCGEQRLIVQHEPASGVMTLLESDGSVQSHLRLSSRMEGPWRENVPHGRWTITNMFGEETFSIDYRNGEPIDCRREKQRDLSLLNILRGLRGLPRLTDRDFPAGEAPDEKRHD
jgi:hypothetical protein